MATTELNRAGPESTRFMRASQAISSFRIDSGLSARLALLVFLVAGACMVVAVPVVARHQWFYLDDWNFLIYRQADNVHDLFAPYGAHWSTLPILFYQALFHVFGLRTYLPYQLPVDVMHFIAALLLRIVMRRAGVGPWIATAAACLFLFFGSGYEDIIWGFQIGYVAALVLGLTQLILSDHDGGIDRRDWLGLAAGALALVCASGVAICLIVVVGLTSLFRRGWRAALFHSVPLALVYAVWWFLVARHYSQSWSPGTLTNPSFDFGWARHVLGGALHAISQFAVVEVVFVIVLIVGMGLAWTSRDHAQRRTLISTVALLVGTFLFVAITAYARANPESLGYANNPHYFDITAAMTLPALAVSADAIARRWRILVPAALALFIIGMPGNLYTLGHPGVLSAQAPYQIAIRNEILGAANLPLADVLPRSFKPLPFFAPPLTLGWLLDQKAVGHLPQRAPSAVDAAEFTLAAALKQSNGTLADETCAPLLQPVTSHFKRGDTLWVGGGNLSVRYVASTRPSLPVTISPVAGRKISVLASRLTLMLMSSNQAEPASLCHGRATPARSS